MWMPLEPKSHAQSYNIRDIRTPWVSWLYSGVKIVISKPILFHKQSSANILYGNALRQPAGRMPQLKPPVLTRVEDSHWVHSELEGSNATDSLYLTVRSLRLIDHLPALQRAEEQIVSTSGILLWFVQIDALTHFAFFIVIFSYVEWKLSAVPIEDSKKYSHVVLFDWCRPLTAFLTSHTSWSAYELNDIRDDRP